MVDHTATARIQRLVRWLESFRCCFGHRAQLLSLRTYVQGVFSDSERKSMQAMLARVTEPVAYQARIPIVADGIHDRTGRLRHQAHRWCAVHGATHGRGADGGDAGERDDRERLMDPGAAWVLVTVTLVNAVAARAVQISATPKRVAARCTRVHVRPAPEIVSVCELTAGGPSDEANATSCSLGAVVLKGGVVRVPAPSEEIVTSMVGAATAGPSETANATALPGATLAPAAGFWLMTLPAGTVALFAVVMAPTVRPVPVIAVCAAACVSATTFGTTVTAGPSEITNATALPGATLAPGAGFWLITLPAGTAALLAVVMAPTVRPAALTQ